MSIRLTHQAVMLFYSLPDLLLTNFYLCLTNIERLQKSHQENIR